MFILGKKSKMTQIWKDGKIVPVTAILAPANTVSQVRTKEKDTYEAVQLSLGKTKREFKRTKNELKKGDTVTVEVFKEGEKIRVSGLTKGKGFQGVVKRHGFHGGPKTHGQKNRFRAPGSIGSTAPQRVVPGRRMAGHMGVERVTVKNLVIAGIDVEKNLLLVKGAVPGHVGSVLEIETLK